LKKDGVSSPAFCIFAGGQLMPVGSRNSRAGHAAWKRDSSAGARCALQSVDESSIKDVPGVVKLVRDGDFLGVVTEAEWAGRLLYRRRLNLLTFQSMTLPIETRTN